MPRLKQADGMDNDPPKQEGELLRLLEPDQDDAIRAADDAFFETYGFRILQSLRRIIRGIDIHSRKLSAEFNVTTPQMVCLYSIVRDGPMTLSELGKAVSLGGSTIVGIVDRLEEKGLAWRERSLRDRRKVLIKATEEGVLLTRNAPKLLQDKLSAALRCLPELEQATIALSLERIVALMEVEALDASPNLIPEATPSDEPNHTMTPAEHPHETEERQ